MRRLHSRRGFTLFLILIGLLVVATSMFLARSRHLVGLAARQRALIAQVRAEDVPGRLQPAVPCETIPVQTPAGHWLDVPYLEDDPALEAPEAPVAGADH
ncbi:MAG: hypothetical protein OZSIB_3246 [Candidatus Ozemobacter sibiricus]|uniref:Uncharacterized protein n=1 Tax=Candidatus Ozemobacter sibiricus TaxID=2268124 RepID=A0A367ZR30_9BACT|nr:MAG: hypothetical protein OZSIB_3246 [Candidatus Ozemobacter sibiricus]